MMMKATYSRAILFFIGVLFFGFVMFHSDSRKLRKKPLTAKDCECKSESSQKTHRFCYVDPQNLGSIGVKFHCEHLKILEGLNLLDNPGPFVNFSDSLSNEKDIVFCSALSDNHFEQALKSYKSIREFNPTRKFIIYGLDLSPEKAQRFRKEKNVEYRDFNTSGYPKYVNNWMEYRFKPLIIAEVMREHKNIWWMDAHMNVNKNGNEMTGKLFKEIVTLPSPIVMFVDTGHSNFATLLPELLDFIPSNSPELLKRAHQLGANSIYVARTELTVKIFKWWILCALDETCMSPPGAQVYCKFGKNRFDYFAGCFRFDQLVLNVLLLNEFQDHHKFHGKLEYLLERN